MSGRFDSGGRIDRTQPIAFTFAGRAYHGFAGDTLASALLAGGVRLVGRSFKLHRPRGVMAAGVEEPNAIVDVVSPSERRPNLRATEVELRDGLAAQPVNCWPSLDIDLGAVNSLIAPFIPVGFYYKTFFWPGWRFFEPFIRRAAGLGRASKTPVCAQFDHQFAHCDVLVAGGGRAGLVAATQAAETGGRVILCEQDFELGGALLWDAAGIDEQTGAGELGASVARLQSLPNVTVLLRTTAIGCYDHGAVTLAERLADGGIRLWQVRADHLVLATGAIERPLVFPSNDRPGVMLASAVLQYQERFAVRLARRAVVFTNNDAAYATAAALAARGAETTVVDVRRQNAIAPKGDVTVLAGAAVVATRGRKALTGVTIRLADGAIRRIDCDLLAVSGGYGPNLQLLGQAGGDLAKDAARLGISVVGAAALADTAAGGLDPPIAGKGKAFVDFQNDVTVDDIAVAVREGFVSVEHLKRYTALGMGTDQGRTSGVNGRALLGALTGRPIDAVGAPRSRPPVTPVPLGAFAGRARGELLSARRRTPLHSLHQALGGALEDYGGWSRPACYPQAGESEAAAVQREALAVRNGVGLFDGSPLGKIEVVGPDAGEFLDRIYANTMSSLPVGRARYGLMLNERGVIIDDGVTARLGATHFLVGTTSGGADLMAAWLEEWRQCEWPGLGVLIAPVTTAWGVVTVAGPRARQLLEAAGGGIDLSGEAFPHMSVRQGRVAGIDARVMRVSFSGELSYEVNVPASRSEDLWRALAGGGREAEATPVGVEAWLLLRLEKGFLLVGADTDGTTAPDDVGFGHVLRRKKDFVGKRSLSRPDNLRPDRPQLVGLEALDGRPMPPGAHLVRAGSQEGLGFVTSAGHSPSLGRPVALALVKAGRSRLGETLDLIGEGAPARARLVERAAYDPQGERLDG